MLNQQINFYCLLLFHSFIYGQVGINTINPSSASVLDVSSSSDNINFGGFLPPRVSSTAERNAINAAPSDIGLLIFVDSTGCYQIWNGIYWEDIHCVTNATHATNLFISEYIEGSGFNKIIEVANFTGSSIDLDDFKISVYVNGSNSSSQSYVFSPGTILSNGEVYIIAHPSSSYTGTINDTFGWSFNGNDVVELQTTTNISIDIIGNIGDTSDFAIDVTLRKKSGIGPNTSYVPADYDLFPADTFSGLGSHSY
jgi:hypothetical protein